MTAEAPKLESQMRRRLLLGLLITVLLVGGLGGWAAVASISSAVIAPGLIVVDGHGKKVQHPTGGVIGEILVKGGSTVEAGEVVIRLDPTQTRAALGVVTSQQVQLEGRLARLAAERDQAKNVTFPKGYVERSKEAADIAESEQRLYAARMSAKEGQKSQYSERIGQFRKEIEGLQSQLLAKETEVKLVTEEYERVHDMYKKQLTPITRVLTAERDVTRLQGEQGALVSNIARAKGQISETEVQIISLDQNMQSESMKELREVEARLAELAERRNAAQDQLDRIDIGKQNRRRSGKHRLVQLQRQDIDLVGRAPGVADKTGKTGDSAPEPPRCHLRYPSVRRHRLAQQQIERKDQPNHPHQPGHQPLRHQTRRGPADHHPQRRRRDKNQ